MSWMNRLKQTLGSGPNDAAVSRELRPAAARPEKQEGRSEREERTFHLPPVQPVDPGSVSPGDILELLCADLVALGEGKLDRGEIDEEGHLFDYGYVDSLSAVAFLARIEERFGVQIEDIELLDGVSSLRAIVERVRLC